MIRGRQVRLLRLPFMMKSSRAPEAVAGGVSGAAGEAHGSKERRPEIQKR